MRREGVKESDNKTSATGRKLRMNHWQVNASSRRLGA